jgi:DNA-binding NarL/FixJ family response regulator
MEVIGEAKNGLEAVQLVEEHRPDVVVLDLSMPVMDGFEAIPEITRISPDTSIVMYSAHASTEIQEKAKQLGAHHFVQKGGDPMEVIGSVQQECAAG